MDSEQAHLMETANRKFAEMSQKAVMSPNSLKEFIMDGRVRIYALPKLDTAMTFSLS